MLRLTMKERRELLCHYLQDLSDRVANYSISDWAVDRLLLALIKLGDRDRSIFEVINEKDKLDLPSLIEETIERESLFTEVD